MNSKELQEQITDMVSEQLRNGRVPWRKPFSGISAPTSLGTGKVYQGVNYWLLSLAGEKYKYPLWTTYKGAVALGGNVNKGEKGTTIIKYDLIERVNPLDPKKTDKIPVMRAFTVFNVEQCSNLTIPNKYLVKRNAENPVVAVEEILTDYKDRPEIYHSIADRAYFDIMADTITLPNHEQFESANDYFRTLAHELAHSTGHESRLKRDIKNTFGCGEYAKEELVAEMASAMLCDHYGVEVDYENTASYISSWLKALDDDKSLIIKASSLASKAVAYITGTKQEVKEEEKEEVGA